MTQSSRTLLARFFKVHPGFLVDDPEGYHTELVSDLRTTEGQLDVWLLQGFERFASHPAVSEVLIKVARDKDTRRLFCAARRNSKYAGASRPLVRGPAPARRARCRHSTKEANHMTWSDFYLICFAVGFLLSAISFLFGGVRGHTHLPHLPHAGGHTLNTHTFGGHGDSATHGNGGAGGHASQHSVSPFNFVTLTAFLAWFGGTGFLITRFSGIWFALGLVIAMAAGLLGAGIVFLFLTRVLISHEENMDAADYEMVGVLGRTSISIRESGTGEIIYSQAGTRRTCGARSESGSAIAKGAEVVVTRYDKGIAYVRLWDEMNEETPTRS